MKHFIKLWVYNAFSLWIISEILPAFRISGGWKAIFLSGFFLALLFLLVKPVLKILFIPINILTFGVLSWMVNVIVVYLLTIVAPGVSVVPWVFPGVSWNGFIIPSFTFSYWLSLILATLGITCITNILENLSS